MEEQLKSLMGDSYKEGMSADEIQSFFKKQVLESGEYENKDKATAEKKKLEQKIADLNKQLSGKMSDDEKKAAEKADEEAAMLQKLEDLEKELAISKAQNSRTEALNGLAGVKAVVTIEDKDKEFEELVSSISFEDSKKSNKVGTIISTLVKKAYEQGKSDATKNKLAKMGSFKEGSDEGAEEKGAFGKQLAQTIKASATVKKDFFKKE